MPILRRDCVTTLRMVDADYAVMMAVDYSFHESYLHPTGVSFYEAKVGNRLFLSTGIPLYTNYFHLALVAISFSMFFSI